ncbi:intradiol ring-cleavage dioxygenase [Nocardiopsis ganjiahuensis]|uniref:intradiol ring-cleavage dioxygenase n=1 Tax=Nocardiopsis ganjiahuensis TaxID=239984 RepID=UPI000A00FF57|nr:intradiol ring-cleavage dioxygenase [Nocardiopsis ganjiahuensis]
MPERTSARPGTSRRAALGAGLTAAGLAACTGPGNGGAAPKSGPAPVGAPPCVLTPEGTEGPYYLDLDLVCQDLAEGRPGVPLALHTTVVDAATCEPLPDASVDVWHADATGVYSGIRSAGTEGERFLRGVQVTDEEGTAEFATLYPGWYDRRTVHIHVKVHVAGNAVHTGQLYFDDETNALVAAADPYAGREDPVVVNADDMFSGTIGPENTLQVTGSPEEGYQADIVLGVRA